MKENELNNSQSLRLPNLAECERFGQVLAKCVTAPITIALNGTLGAGKTQFIRFFAVALGVAPEDVTSPTYVLIQKYVGRLAIYHFDFYRLNSEDEVWNLGIDELFEQSVVVMIEWADKFHRCLPDDHLELLFTEQDDQSRIVQLTAYGPASPLVLEKSIARFSSVN